MKSLAVFNVLSTFALYGTFKNEVFNQFITRFCSLMLNLKLNLFTI